MKKKKKIRNQLYTSVLLVLMALVAVTAATVAWFSIADNTKVRSMSLDIMTDVDLRMDLDAHSSIEQYVKTLSFESIAARIQQEKGFSVQETPLNPVTTTDCNIFSFENGSTVESTSGSYLEFTLHFMAEKDMVVHLTSANSSDTAEDGTLVSSGNSQLPQAMRISFSTDNQNWVYDPGMEDSLQNSGNLRSFGLNSPSVMRISDNNALFSLKQGQDKAVVVHIWMEGTDEACTDELQSADYSIRLRFTGTDEEGNTLSGQ